MIAAIKKALRSERGQVLTIAIAFTALAIPTVTAALQLASSLALDSGLKSNTLRSHYNTLGAQQFAIHVLHTTTTYPTSTDIGIDINGTPVTTTIVKKVPPPTLPTSLSSSFKGHNVSVTKAVNTTSTTAGSTVTYTVTIENRAETKKFTVNKVYDLLPEDFGYVEGTSSFAHEGTVVTTMDPTTSHDDSLQWNVPNTALEPGESATMVFDALIDSGIADGAYCNEAWVSGGTQGNSKASSGKTAKITIGSPAETSCAGVVIDLDVSVSPSIVQSEMLETFTYTITVDSMGTDATEVARVYHSFCAGLDEAIACDFTYTTNSETSTPGTLDLSDIDLDTNEVEYDMCTRGGTTCQEAQAMASGEFWTIEFTATATLDRGQYPAEVELEGVNFGFDAITTWPTAAITVFDYYTTTGGDGETSYECNVWIGTDLEGNDVTLLEDCAFVTTIPAASPTPTPTP